MIFFFFEKLCDTMINIYTLISKSVCNIFEIFFCFYSTIKNRLKLRTAIYCVFDFIKKIMKNVIIKNLVFEVLQIEQ